MSMPPIDLGVFDALTEAGVKPDAARKVERQIETVIQSGHEQIRAEMREQLMTKADGLQLKAELKAEFHEGLAGVRNEVLRALNEQTWKLVSFVVVANGIMLALLKYLS